MTSGSLEFGREKDSDYYYRRHRDSLTSIYDFDPPSLAGKLLPNYLISGSSVRFKKD